MWKSVCVWHSNLRILQHSNEQPANALILEQKKMRHISQQWSLNGIKRFKWKSCAFHTSNSAWDVAVPQLILLNACLNEQITKWINKQLSKSPIVPTIVLEQNWQPINVCQIKSHHTQPLWQPGRHAIWINLLPREQLAESLPTQGPRQHPRQTQALLPRPLPAKDWAWWDTREALFLLSVIPLTAIFVLGSPSAGQGFLRASLKSEVPPPQASCLPF